VLLFGFAAGVALDRVSIRRALIVADLGRAAAFGLLAFTVASEVPHLVTVFAVAFMVGSLGVLFDSGLQAWLPALLPEERLVVVNSRLQFASTVASTVGLPLANFLIVAGGGFAVAFGVDAATFLVSAAFVLILVEIKPRPRVDHEPWWPSFKAGIRYLWRQPMLRAATGAAMVWNLTFVPMEALLVLFAREALDIPTDMVGWFFAGHALVGASGVVLAPRLTRFIGLGRTFVVGMAMLGGGFLALVLASPWIAGLAPAWSIVAATVPGGAAVAGVSLANVAFFTLRQQIPPQELLGRVVAASRTLAWALIPPAAALGGKLGDVLGVKPVYLGSSLILLVVASLLTLTGLWRHRIEVPLTSR
jgi:Na+/melibiose symporter-like transporter